MQLRIRACPMKDEIRKVSVRCDGIAVLKQALNWIAAHSAHRQLHPLWPEPSPGPRSRGYTQQGKHTRCTSQEYNSGLGSPILSLQPEDQEFQVVTSSSIICKLSKQVMLKHLAGCSHNQMLVLRKELQTNVLSFVSCSLACLVQKQNLWAHVKQC